MRIKRGGRTGGVAGRGGGYLKGLSNKALISYKLSKLIKPSPITYKDINKQYIILTKQYIIDILNIKNFKA